MPSHRRRRAIRLSILALVVGAIAFFAIPAAVRYSQPAVSVTRVVRGPVVQAFYATGTLEPVREYTVRSSLAGSVVRVLVDKGDVVRMGQPVAVVRDDTGEGALKLRQAEQELAIKRLWADPAQSVVLKDFDERRKKLDERVEIASAEVVRLTRLLENQSTSQNEVNTARDTLLSVRSEADSILMQKAMKKQELDKDVSVAEEGLRIAKANFERTIPSPVDGRVLDWPVSPGTRVELNGKLMVVADVRPDRLVMRAAVDEEDKTLLKQGQDVDMTLYSFNNQVLHGQVERVYPKADTERRTFEVDVQMDDLPGQPGAMRWARSVRDSLDALDLLGVPALSHPLQQLMREGLGLSGPRNYAAGMTGELVFIIATRDRALVVPRQAVSEVRDTQPAGTPADQVRRSGKVWAVRGNKLVKIDAVIGLLSVERAEILQGLSEGDTVVISPASGLADGRSARISEEVDPDEAANINKPKDNVQSHLFGG